MVQMQLCLAKYKILLISPYHLNGTVSSSGAQLPPLPFRLSPLCLLLDSHLHSPFLVSGISSLVSRFTSLLFPLRLLKNLIMQLANNAIHQTHYDVLDVKEDASQEEIRTSYRSALLSSHPDKLHKTNSDHNQPEVRFLEIQTAWEILGDVKSRALYDRELQVSRQDEVTADEVELEDLTVDTSGDVVELFYQCRCGDYFSLDSLELREMGFELLMEGNKISLQAPDNAPLASIILPCGSCSLKIRLVISKDTRP